MNRPMACFDMYSSSSSTNGQNSDHKGLSCGAPMSPRISFSNDFAESNHSHHQQFIKPRETPPPSSDFEFSVSNHSMMSADELFFKGRLLPFKDSCSNQLQKPTTLREELMVDDEEDDHEFSLRPPKGSTRWKGILGLKKTHIGSTKKSAKPDGSMEKRPGFVSNSSQEVLNDGGSSCRDVEFGM
ncbi:unnamed protein product [Camellia sinensis]